jgi:hypothetical protein
MGLNHQYLLSIENDMKTVFLNIHACAYHSIQPVWTQRPATGPTSAPVASAGSIGISHNE